MPSDNDLSPIMALKHHLLPLEVDHNAKALDDRTPKKHWSLASNDEGLNVAKGVVDEDRHTSNPVARGGMVAAKVESARRLGHCNSIHIKSKLSKMVHITVERT